MTQTLSIAREVFAWIFSSGLEIAAIALSPFIALRVSERLDREREEHNRKLWILQTLMATRHAPFADDRIRALNMVDVLFPGDENVRNARRKLMAALSDQERMNPDGSPTKELLDEWNERQWLLVSAMAALLKVPMTEADFKAGYAPKALSDLGGQQLLAAELNRTMVMYFRNQLGMPWNPSALFKMPENVAMRGVYQEPSAQAAPPIPDEPEQRLDYP